jgi:hypothetical protein
VSKTSPPQERAHPIAAQAVQAMQPRLHPPQPERFDARPPPEQATIKTMIARQTINKLLINPFLISFASFAVFRVQNALVRSGMRHCISLFSGTE